jgi:hypothetical protein
MVIGLTRPVPLVSVRENAEMGELIEERVSTVVDRVAAAVQRRRRESRWDQMEEAPEEWWDREVSADNLTLFTVIQNVLKMGSFLPIKGHQVLSI